MLSPVHDKLLFNYFRYSLNPEAKETPLFPNIIKNY